MEVHVITLKPHLGKKLQVAKLSNFMTQLREERPGFTLIQYLTLNSEKLFFIFFLIV